MNPAAAKIRSALASLALHGAEPPTLAAEYHGFLYASVGAADDEVPLSVLSALARQNLDPWEEAGRLAGLPRKAAIIRLAEFISASDDGSRARLDASTTAARLLELLPPSRGYTSPTIGLFATPLRNVRPIAIYLICVALIIVSALLAN